MADPAGTTYTSQIVREDPEIAAKRLGFLTSAETDIGNKALQLPAYNIAAETPLTSQASDLATKGVGSYQPYLESAQGALTGSASTYNQAQGILGAGLTAANAAFPGAYGYLGDAGAAGNAAVSGAGNAVGTAAQGMINAGGMYNPNDNVSQFFNPYLNDVVNQQYNDIARQGQIQSQQAGLNAARAGAFGGSRGALAQSEIGRNTMDTQARTGSQLRASGYQQALDASQKAYENSMARQQQAYQQVGSQGLEYGKLGMTNADLNRQLGLAGGTLAGQQGEISRALGLGIGSIGTEMGKLGVQEGALGELSSKLNTSDIENTSKMGEVERQQQQRELDAQRATTLQQMYEPYQRASYMMDLYKGTPSSQQTLTANTAPTTSLASQVVGTGITALGGAAALNKSGLV